MDAADDDGVGWLDADDVQAAVATGELAFDGLLLAVTEPAARAAISWSNPMRRSGTVPPSPPSWQPPTNSPPAKTWGTVREPVRFVSCARCQSLAATSVNATPASHGGAAFASSQYGQSGAENTTTGAASIISAMGV